MRTTAIIGAGAVLDLIPQEGAIFPSTKRITEEVVNIQMTNSTTSCPITEIRDAYEALVLVFGKDNVNFEMLFHALESYYAYSSGWWQEACANPDMFPAFAPLTRPKLCLDPGNIRLVLNAYLLRIMDIVNSYNEPFIHDVEEGNFWYRDFWRNYPWRSDSFVLNYDTTLEHSLGKYEDGYEVMANEPDVQRFVPQNLWSACCRDLPTVCHLHGTILYFDRWNPTNNPEELVRYDFHDMYKYDSYHIVKEKMESSSKSLMNNQAGEQFANTPIITGLRKTDKLNIMPFDFYHGHLYNCILNNHSLLIVGYSFGDLYVNHVIERMALIHRDRKRIVLIDYWTRSIEIGKLTSDGLSSHLMDFIQRMTDRPTIDDALSSFRESCSDGPLKSENGCLMLFIRGFKDAVCNHQAKIYEFFTQ